MDFSTLYKENKLVRITAVVLGLLCLILGFASPYYFADFGIGSRDEPGMVLLAWDYHNAPMTFLSTMVTGLWGTAFGFHMLSMRYFAITVQMLAYAIACIFMYRRIRKPVLCLFIAGLGAYAFNSASNLTLIGWDPISIFFVTLTAIATLRYIEKQSYLNIILMAIFGVGATYARLPNIVLFPFIVAMMVVYNYKTILWRVILKQLVVFVGIASLLLIGTLCISFGGIVEYLDAIKANVVGAHGLENYIVQLDMFAMIVFPIFAVTWIFYFAIKKIEGLQPGWMFTVILLLWCIFTFYSAKRVYYSDYLTMVAFAYFIVAVCCAWKNKSQNVAIVTELPHWISILKEHTPVITICAFSLVAVFGSNVIYLKLCSIVFLPLLYAYGWTNYSRTFVIYSLFVGLAMVPLIYRKTQVVAPFGFDSGTNKATASVACPLYKGIKTHPFNAQYLDNLYNEIKLTANTEQLFMSNWAERNIAYYMINKIPEFDLHNWSDKSFSNREIIKRNIDFIHSCSKPISVFVLRKSGGDPEAIVKDTQPTEDALVKEGLVKVKEYGTFAIYSRPK